MTGVIAFVKKVVRSIVRTLQADLNLCWELDVGMNHQNKSTIWGDLDFISCLHDPLTYLLIDPLKRLLNQQSNVQRHCKASPINLAYQNSEHDRMIKKNVK